MNATDQRKITDLMGSTDCPRHFKCAASGFEQLCKAIDLDHKDVIVCLESHPETCYFSVPSAQGFLCRCPIRGYLARMEAHLQQRP